MDKTINVFENVPTSVLFEIDDDILSARKSGNVSDKIKSYQKKVADNFQIAIVSNVYDLTVNMFYTELTKRFKTIYKSQIQANELPEIKSLRWLANNFPFTDEPKDEIDKISNAINLYATAGANKLEELRHIIMQLNSTN